MSTSPSVSLIAQAAFTPGYEQPDQSPKAANLTASRNLFFSSLVFEALALAGVAVTGGNSIAKGAALLGGVATVLTGAKLYSAATKFSAHLVALASQQRRKSTVTSSPHAARPTPLQSDESSGSADGLRHRRPSSQRHQTIPDFLREQQLLQIDTSRAPLPPSLVPTGMDPKQFQEELGIAKRKVLVSNVGRRKVEALITKKDQLSATQRAEVNTLIDQYNDKYDLGMPLQHI